MLSEAAIREQTLEELDGQDWGEPRFESHVVVNCHRLRRVPLKDFTTEDLRLMIGQRINLDYLVPLALEQLENDPLASGDFYDGDLQDSIKKVPTEFWNRHSDLLQRWRNVLAEGESSATLYNDAVSR